MQGAVHGVGKVGVLIRKGFWTAEEDELLRQCIKKFGEGNWHRVPERAGINRCRKSCRLRWLNYLRPNIKRGNFQSDEVDLIIRLHKLLGNRWSLIAGRLPGRTANDVKNYWNTRLIHDKLLQSSTYNSTNSCRPSSTSTSSSSLVIKPRPLVLSKTLSSLQTARQSSELALKKPIHEVPAIMTTPPLLEEMRDDHGPADSNGNGSAGGDDEMWGWWWKGLLTESDDKYYCSSGGSVPDELGGMSGVGDWGEPLPTVDFNLWEVMDP